MCSSFAVTSTPERLKQHFNYLNPAEFPPRERIRPTEPIMIIREANANKRELVLVRWGFIPHWVKDPDDFPLIINARAETLMEKPSFRTATAHKRCLIPADAFYEWSGPKGNKAIHKLEEINKAPLAFAALWEHWLGADGSEFESAVIITVAANEEASQIHDRTPALIEAKDFDSWLDVKNVRNKEALKLLRPARPGSFHINNLDALKAKPIKTKSVKTKPKPAQKELF